MKKLFLIPLMACFTCMAFATEKFYLGVTNDQNQEVAMSVTDGVTMHFKVPASKTMNEANLKLNFMVYQVPALGISAKHEKEYNMNLGLTGNVNLYSKLPAVYDFGATNMLVSVKADGTSQTARYTISGYDNEAGEILAAPSATNESMAAWNLFANQLNTNSNEFDFSTTDKIVIKEGSYIQFGGESITFDNCVLSVNFWTETNLKEFMIRSIYDGNAAADNVLYLAAGTTMYMGSKAAQLKQDVTVTLKNGTSVDTEVLKQFRNLDPATSFKGFAALLNEIAAYVGSADYNYLTINFGDELKPEEQEVIPEEDELVVLRSGVATNRYSTICLPYGVKDFAGATFYEIAYKEGTKLYMAEVTTGLTAGKPYIFSAVESTITGHTDGFWANEPQNDDANGLHGVFESQTITNPGNLYGFSQNILKKLANPSLLAANRAYIDLSEVTTSSNVASNRPLKVVAIEEVATGMDEMQVEVEGTKKMIVNGQLIILRDGVKYNAQGAVIE